MAIRHLKREDQPHWDAVRERFLREAQTLQVRHPNLLHVHDFGEDATGVFVVTDLVAGPSLRNRLAAGPLPWPLARQFTLQMVDAAAALHANGGLLTGVNPDTIRVHRRRRRRATGALVGRHPGAGRRAVDHARAAAARPGIERTRASVHCARGADRPAPDSRADVFTVGAIAVYLVTAGRRSRRRACRS